MKPVLINISIEKFADKIESCKSGKASDVEKTLNRILKNAIQSSSHQSKDLSVQSEIDFLRAAHQLEVHLIRSENLEVRESYLKDLSLMKAIFLDAIHSNKRLEQKCNPSYKEETGSHNAAASTKECFCNQLKNEFQF
jgi:hypothetical protein